LQGSAIPSPSASTPQRNHVSGMNCIQPIAPAELGPMFCPKFDSILLIAARTCHGTPYAAAARCQSGSNCATVSCCVTAGRAVKLAGTDVEPGARGVAVEGREAAVALDAADVVKPSPGPSSARPAPAATAKAAAAATRSLFISLRDRPAAGPACPARAPAAA